MYTLTVRLSKPEAQPIVIKLKCGERNSFATQAMCKAT
jgi:hypothetical protein